MSYTRLIFDSIMTVFFFLAKIILTFVIFIFIPYLLSWPKDNKLTLVFKKYKTLLTIVVNEKPFCFKHESLISTTLLARRWFPFADSIFAKNLVKWLINIFFFKVKCQKYALLRYQDAEDLVLLLMELKQMLTSSDFSFILWAITNNTGFWVLLEVVS